MKHRDDFSEEWIHGYITQRAKIGTKHLIKRSSAEDNTLQQMSQLCKAPSLGDRLSTEAFLSLFKYEAWSCNGLKKILGVWILPGLLVWEGQDWICGKVPVLGTLQPNF